MIEQSHGPGQTPRSPLWHEELQVRSHEADARGILKLHSLFGFFSEVAGNHAAHLGVGYHELREAGFFWVLSRIKVQVVRLPRWGERVHLETWPKGVEKLFALRDFQMADGAGSPLVSATSAWLLLDTGRSRPHKIDVLPLPIPIRGGVHAIHELPGKLKPVEGLQQKYGRRILPSDLDVNNHVNNAEYVRWVADCLDQVEAGSVVSLQINYLEEALLGDTVDLLAGPAGPDCLRVEVRSSSKGSSLAQAEIGLARPLVQA